MPKIFSNLMLNLPFRIRALVAIACLVLIGCAAPQPSPSTVSVANKALLVEADAVKPVMRQPLAPVVAEFFSQVSALPAVAPRTLYRHKTTKQWINAAQWAKLAEPEKADWTAKEFDEAAYYGTLYGTPLAYALALDAAALYGLKSLKGLRVVDYGYGAIGSPRLMAQAGAQVVGLDVDSLQPALYNQASDTGAVGVNKGSITLINANFPADAQAVQGAGLNNDLIISKNTLKKGYITPEQGKAFIDPGVPLTTYLQAFRDALKPGGLFVIYNISQKQDAEKYRPANDPRSPFTRAEYEAAGFEVLALDADDSAQVRRFGDAAAWGGPQGMGDLQTNLFAKYTVLRRAAK
jgi:hypothetical protein